MAIQKAKFSIGDIVKHKHFEFRGVIYDVDFEFNNSEEWYQSIPKNVRPRKDQPFYHLLAENDEITYEAYVSEQNLLMDDSDEPIKHPLIEEIFWYRLIPFFRIIKLKINIVYYTSKLKVLMFYNVSYRKFSFLNCH